MTSEAEGISRVYIEALACERPLLASDIAAAREVIEDGRNGFLFPLGDHRALAECILAFLGDPALCNEVGRSGRASVAHRSLESAALAYVQELQGLLHRDQRVQNV
jgi:glycosyltransferase involved in cell wall biosynthesis